MNTLTQFLRSDPAMYTSPGRTYARVGVRDPARMYVRGPIYFLAPWPLYVRVHATCAPLLRHVRASTPTSMHVHIRDQNDNATYASTRRVPTVRHFLACEDVAAGTRQLHLRMQGSVSGQKKRFAPLTAGTHQLHLRTQGSTSGQKKTKTIRPPDCWDTPATSLHARKCLTVGTHLVEAYLALSFWSRTCTYILVGVEACTCRSRGAHVACTRTNSGQCARKKIRPRMYIRAESRTPTRAYVHGWVGT